jgi:hypothetical protein
MPELENLNPNLSEASDTQFTGQEKAQVTEAIVAFQII